MSTSYGGTPTGITGTHFGGAGLGCPGSLIPSEGLDGPGYLFAGLSLPADAAMEVRGPITRWPADTLTVYEDSAFSYTGATDFALFAVYVDGVASTDDIGYGPGIGRVDLGVGPVAGVLAGSVGLDDCSPGGGLATWSSLLHGDMLLEPQLPGGGLESLPGAAAATMAALSPDRARQLAQIHQQRPPQIGGGRRPVQ